MRVDIKKFAFLALGVLIVVSLAIASMSGNSSRSQSSRPASQPAAQQPLMINDSTWPSLQTQSSGLNPQGSSASPQPSATSSPGATELEGNDSGTPNWYTSPCYRCAPGPGRVCPDMYCPELAE